MKKIFGEGEFSTWDEAEAQFSQCNTLLILGMFLFFVILIFLGLDNLAILALSYILIARTIKHVFNIKDDDGGFATLQAMFFFPAIIMAIDLGPKDFFSPKTYPQEIHQKLFPETKTINPQ